MTTSPTRFYSVLAPVAISLGLSLGIAPSALAAPAAPQPMPQQEPQRHQEMIKMHLAKMAERLEIKPSQQNAWQTYAKTYTSIMGGHMMQRPNENADAAAIVRHQADMTSEHAQKMLQLADATAKLQETLTPEQRQTLANMVRRVGMFHRGWMMQKGQSHEQGKSEQHGMHGME